MGKNVGQSIDNLMNAPTDFFIDSFNFIKGNIDQVLMITIIFFLILTWTTIYKWEFPKKENVILRKKIKFENNDVDVEGFDNTIKTRDEVMEEQLKLDCTGDPSCNQHKLCLKEDTFDKCSNNELCNYVKFKGVDMCVGGNSDGPTYNKDTIDEWWYLGNKN